MNYILAIICFLLVAIPVTYDNAHIWVCLEETTVKEILSVQYRSATFLMENGQQHTLSQATLKPGDTYCLRREQRLIQ